LRRKGGYENHSCQEAWWVNLKLEANEQACRFNLLLQKRLPAGTSWSGYTNELPILCEEIDRFDNQRSRYS
jgi:hypothetical protein